MNIQQSPAWSFMRTPGNGVRVTSTVGVSTRAAVIGRATVGQTGNRAAQAVPYRSEAASVGGLVIIIRATLLMLAREAEEQSGQVPVVRQISRQIGRASCRERV